MMNFQSARAARGSGSILAFVKSRGRWARVRLKICCPAGPFSGDEPADGPGLGLERWTGMECGDAFHDLIMHGGMADWGLDSRQNGRVFRGKARDCFRLRGL